jgi:sugar/nucleoside kinase (ribokinase family)
MVLSEEDLPKKALPAAWTAWPGILIITQSERGAVGRWHGQWNRIPAHPAWEVNPTGAGDVFTAAFLVRYSETRDPDESALFASAAASIKAEHGGIAGIPTREQVQERKVKYIDLRVTPCGKPF